MRSPRSVAFTQNATNVFFHILTACNLRCRHCYINPAQHGTASLDIDTIRAWLAVFSGGNNPPNVIFLGGEPTLHSDLPQDVRHARSLGYGSITIDTNGYLFHDILHRLHPDDVDYFSFSLDGASPEVNDGLRGPGSYRTCLNGIQQAVSRGFHTSLIYTVSRANLHELKYMPALLLELGIRRFFIQVVGIRGKPAQADAAEHDRIEQVLPDRWLAEVPAAAQQAAEMGIDVIYPKVFLKPGEPFACAGKVADNHFIFPNGRVYRCPLCEDYPLHSQCFDENGVLISTSGITEANLFELDIPEGCVMNRMIQPGNIQYLPDGSPAYRIACCLLKEEICGG
jgi:MoaA/NifB/PqqE/SkfB family radical SAM enzyme